MKVLQEIAQQVDEDDYMTAVRAPKEDFEFFATRPVPCARIYFRFSTSPIQYRPLSFLSRHKKEGSLDTFFSQTINSPETISHLLALFRKDVLNPNRNHISPSKADKATCTNPLDWPDLMVLVHIGSRLNGFGDTVHGGVLASLLDESMSNCVEVIRQLHCEDRSNLYAANLNISYRAPAFSPGILVIKTWLKRREERKWYLEGAIVDASGNILVEGTALWIQAMVKAKAEL